MNYILFAIILFQAPHHAQHTVYLRDQISVAAGSKQSDVEKGGIRDAHTEPGIMAELSKACTTIRFTEEKRKADTFLEIDSSEARVLSRKGASLYISHAASTSDRAKDACRYIADH
jgi:hypothetical protein